MKMRRGERFAAGKGMRRVGPRVCASAGAAVALVMCLEAGASAHDDVPTPLTPHRILTPTATAGPPRAALPLAFEQAGDDAATTRARGYVARITRLGAQVAVQDGEGAAHADLAMDAGRRERRGVALAGGADRRGALPVGRRRRQPRTPCAGRIPRHLSRHRRALSRQRAAVSNRISSSRQAQRPTGFASAWTMPARR